MSRPFKIRKAEVKVIRNLMTVGGQEFEATNRMRRRRMSSTPPCGYIGGPSRLGYE